MGCSSFSEFISRAPQYHRGHLRTTAPEELKLSKPTYPLVGRRYMLDLRCCLHVLGCCQPIGPLSEATGEVEPFSDRGDYCLGA